MTIAPDRPNYGDLAYGAGYYGGPAGGEALILSSAGSSNALAVVDYATARESGNDVHRTLANSVIVVLAPGLPRSGELELIYLDEQAAHHCMQLHAEPATFQITVRGRATWAMSYAVARGQVRLSREGGSRNGWRVTVPYQELSG